MSLVVTVVDPHTDALCLEAHFINVYLVGSMAIITLVNNGYPSAILRGIGLLAKVKRWVVPSRSMPRKSTPIALILTLIV